ncbi:hypothetical protein PR003_g13885 [Phytophthora rubi]|uniref:Secreted protein n=1 Tax=Phytophthora rubi TaxID=129364 RepID=A0A6A3L110_9STRA|nr:hypothetical protein PR002_g14995 [Phytophthora rubi]KAE9333713.1 hypothetical protein PR003_g13885 [Phytophthora rubi]
MCMHWLCTSSACLSSLSSLTILDPSLSEDNASLMESIMLITSKISLSGMFAIAELNQADHLMLGGGSGFAMTGGVL